jgi:hypothetical protein
VQKLLEKRVNIQNLFSAKLGFPEVLNPDSNPDQHDFLGAFETSSFL